MKGSLVCLVFAVALAASAQMMPRGELIFQESFSDNQHGWSVGGFGDRVADTLLQREFNFKNGEYWATSRDWGARAWCTECGVYGDAVYELIARFKEGGENAFYGVVFRVNPDNTNQFYLFEVYADGAYSMWRYNTDETWTSIVPKTESDVVVAGKGTNILGVVARGDHFDLYVNNVKVGEAEDSAYSDGWVGVYVETGGGNTGTASFDALRIYTSP